MENDGEDAVRRTVFKISHGTEFTAGDVLDRAKAAPQIPHARCEAMSDSEVAAVLDELVEWDAIKRIDSDDQKTWKRPDMGVFVVLATYDTGETQAEGVYQDHGFATQIAKELKEDTENIESTTVDIEQLNAVGFP